MIKPGNILKWKIEELKRRKNFYLYKSRTWKVFLYVNINFRIKNTRQTNLFPSEVVSSNKNVLFLFQNSLLGSFLPSHLVSSARQQIALYNPHIYAEHYQQVSCPLGRWLVATASWAQGGGEVSFSCVNTNEIGIWSYKYNFAIRLHRKFSKISNSSNTTEKFWAFKTYFKTQRGGTSLLACYAVPEDESLSLTFCFRLR